MHLPEIGLHHVNILNLVNKKEKTMEATFYDFEVPFADKVLKICKLIKLFKDIKEKS